MSPEITVVGFFFFFYNIWRTLSEVNNMHVCWLPQGVESLGRSEWTQSLKEGWVRSCLGHNQSCFLKTIFSA